MEIKLQDAHLLWSSTSYGWCEGVSVSIDVENLGYEKEVLIHLADGCEKMAEYKKQLPNNRELWVWNSSYYDPEGCLVWGKGLNRIKFCLKYVVNGRTYWDNNGGWDYCIQWDEPIAPAVWSWPSSFDH